MFCYKNGLTFDLFQSDLLKGTFQNHHEATNCTKVAKSTNSFQSHQAHTCLYFFFFFLDQRTFWFCQAIMVCESCPAHVLNAALINPWPEVRGGINSCFSLALSFFSSLHFYRPFSLSCQPLSQCPLQTWRQKLSVPSVPNTSKDMDLLFQREDSLSSYFCTPFPRTDLVVPLIYPSFHDARPVTSSLPLSKTPSPPTITFVYLETGFD